jgi:hypothetical protein
MNEDLALRFCTPPLTPLTEQDERVPALALIGNDAFDPAYVRRFRSFYLVFPENPDIIGWDMRVFLS